MLGLFRIWAWFGGWVFNWKLQWALSLLGVLDGLGDSVWTLPAIFKCSASPRGSMLERCWLTWSCRVVLRPSVIHSSLGRQIVSLISSLCYSYLVVNCKLWVSSQVKDLAELADLATQHWRVHSCYIWSTCTTPSRLVTGSDGDLYVNKEIAGAPDRVHWL